MKTVAPFFALILLVAAAKAEEAETREWTSSDGRTIQAKLLEFDGDTVSLEMNGNRFEIPVSRLSDKDQAFAREWADARMAPGEEPGSGESGRPTAPVMGAFEDLQLGAWPSAIEADLDTDDIEFVESKEDGEEQYLYRTPHFEFEAPDRLSISVVREFARIFEASFAFVDQMPIGLAPKPSANGFYKTKLYMRRDDYYSDGGMPGSGGMFSWRRRGNEMSGIIKVPLPNLGVEYTGTRYIVDHGKRSDTLTHEIVHQVMLRWLATPMPTWLSEGIAEVVSSQPYDNGRFRLTSMDRAIKDEVTRYGDGREFSMLGLERLMTITAGEWAAELAAGRGRINYASANVLAYYFLRLDGEGDAAHLVEFLKVLPTGIDEANMREAQLQHLLRDRTFDQLEADVTAAWRSEGLRIAFP